MGIDAREVQRGNELGAIAAEGFNMAHEASLKKTLIRALVMETVYDPTLIDIEAMGTSVRNPDRLQEMPRNTIICRPIEQSSFPPLICYPLFPSHLSVPVKVGEHVWLLQETGDQYFWICRIPGSDICEDVNFTHVDRKFLDPKTLDAKDKVEAEITGPQLPTFLDKTETESTKVLVDPETYASIIQSSKTANFRMEPVPRFTKRPGDLTLQGSNNTLINLGEERGWKINAGSLKQSNASNIPFQGSGAIDIVVGRGRTLPRHTSLAAPGGTPERTSPATVINDLGTIETDKNRGVNLLAQSPVEGDPDFWKDASRIYVTMKTSPDDDFDLSQWLPKGPYGGQGFTKRPQMASIALKSDQIRIIARSDPSVNVNGSIRLIKEGAPSAGGGLSALCLESDGITHLYGTEIYLGQSPTDGGAGGKHQPYVKYTQLNALLTKLCGVISAFGGRMGQCRFMGIGQGSSTLTAAGGELSRGAADVQGMIPDIMSARIFGE